MKPGFDLGSPRQSGLTLVELLIAMALGLLVLLAIVSLYVGSRQTFRIQEDSARLQETGRYAIETLGRSIRQAGFWNMPINPVSTATGFGGVAINGTNGATDTVTVQYDVLVGDRDCEGTVIDAALFTAIGGVVTETYSLNGNNLTCSLNGNNRVCELVCEGVDADAAASPLVSDVEDLQVLYGLNTDNDPRQSVDQYQATPANWAQVVSARVCIQARSANNVNNGPQRFLNCGGALGTAAGAAAFTNAAAGDNTLRRAFVATFNLRNRVSSVP